MRKIIAATATAVGVTVAVMLTGFAGPSAVNAEEPPEAIFIEDMVVATLHDHLDPAGEQRPCFIIEIVEDGILVAVVHPTELKP